MVDITAILRVCERERTPGMVAEYVSAGDSTGREVIVTRRRAATETGDHVYHRFLIPGKLVADRHHDERGVIPVSLLYL